MMLFRTFSRVALVAGLTAIPSVAASADVGSSGLTAASAPITDGGQWRTTGSMLVPREGGGAGNGVHTVTLPDGKVLFAGGYNTEASDGVFTFALQDNYLSSAELYDPSTGIWAPTGSMSQSRFAPAMALLETGKVLVAGGYGGGFGEGVFRNSAELYDPAAGSWSRTSSMNDCRLQPTTSVLSSGKVLVIGGTGCMASSQPTTELYDPVAGTWSRRATMSTARAAHAATTLPDGRILVTGGRATDGLVDRIWASAEIYDPATDSWTTTPPMATGRAFHSAGLLSTGKVIVAGGYCQNQTPVGPSPSLASGCVTDTAEIYDPATNTWTSTANMSVKRVFSGSTVLPNRRGKPGSFLVAGGGGQTSSELYDPLVGTWRATGSLTRIHDDAPVVALGRGLYLMPGGFKAESMTNYRATEVAELYQSPRP